MYFTEICNCFVNGFLRFWVLFRNSSVLGTFLALGWFTALGTDNLQDSRVLKDLAPISLQLVRICEICLRESGMSRRSLQDFNLQLV